MQIRNMITERHNLAYRMIFKAISKTGSLGSCTVSKDIGSNERMTVQNLLIPETAESKIVPKKWLFPPRFPDKDRFTSSRPDSVLVTYSHRCKNTKTTSLSRPIVGSDDSCDLVSWFFSWGYFALSRAISWRSQFIEDSIFWFWYCGIQLAQ